VRAFVPPPLLPPDLDWPGGKRSQTVYTHRHQCSRNAHETQNCERINRQTPRPSVCLSSVLKYPQWRNGASEELESIRQPLRLFPNLRVSCFSSSLWPTELLQPSGTG